MPEIKRYEIKKNRKRCRNYSAFCYFVIFKKLSVRKVVCKCHYSLC